MKGLQLRLRHSSLRYRLVMVILLLGSVSVLVMIAGFSYRIDRMLEEEVQNDGNTLASALDWAITSLLAREHNCDDIQSLLENLAEYRGIDRIRIYNTSHTVLASSVNAEVGKVVRVPMVEEIFEERTPRRENYDHKAGIYSYAIPVRGIHSNSTEAASPTLALFLSLDMSYLKKSFTGLIRGVLLHNIIFAALLSVSLLVLFSFWVLRPLSAFTEAAKLLRQGDYSQRVDLKNSGEFADFADIFNNMAEMIEEKDRHLTMYSEKLELMVKERTEELESSVEELRRAHGTIIQQEKLASIGLLAAGIAHEINNPVGYVLSNLETLGEYMEALGRVLEGAKKIEEAAKRGDLDSVKKAAAFVGGIKEKEDFDFIMEDIPPLLKASLNGTKRVRNIVTDLKNFARSEDNILEDINVNDAVEKALEIAWNELKYKCTLVKKLGEIPPVRSNHAQLVQVLINLLVNAAQAIETRGTVTVTTRFQGTAVEIYVEDTGKGIPPEQIGKVFDPFFTTKDVGKGTGMGLSISHGIISRHGGTIEVNSSPGKGSVFKISLPASPDTDEDSNFEEDTEK